MSSPMTKTILIFLLLLLIDSSSGRVIIGMRRGDMINPENPANDQGIGDIQMMKMMRKLMATTEIEAMLDYEKDPGPNRGHEPPKYGKSPGTNT